MQKRRSGYLPRVVVKSAGSTERGGRRGRVGRGGGGGGEDSECRCECVYVYDSVCACVSVCA